MTCNEFETIIDDLRRPEALNEATYELARFHAQTCNTCGARLAQARSLTSGLQALETSQAGEGAPPQIEAILYSAFLRQKWEAARARTRRQWTAVGIAAALLLTAGLASRLIRKSTAPTQTARAERAAEKNSALPVSSEPEAGSPRAAREANSAAQNEDELTADFVPFPAGGTILPFESGQIVRVNLPGSALVAMGFPIDGDRAADRFTADLLVGEDGLPRAIRFPQ
jgi:hypothetical protein